MGSPQPPGDQARRNGHDSTGRTALLNPGKRASTAATGTTRGRYPCSEERRCHKRFERGRPFLEIKEYLITRPPCCQEKCVKLSHTRTAYRTGTQVNQHELLPRFLQESSRHLNIPHQVESRDPFVRIRTSGSALLSTKGGGGVKLFQYLHNAIFVDVMNND